MEIVSTWPVSDMRALSERLTNCKATHRVMSQADPVLIRADDFDGQHTCGLTEGFVGVPIFTLDGRPVGGVVAYGIPRDLRPESLQILMTLAQRTGSEVQMRDHSAHLEEMVQERTQDLQDALHSLAGAKRALERSQEDLILRLATAAEFRDNETANHLRRLSQYSIMLAGAIGIDDDESQMLRYASLMHDIGKIGIPDEVLLKPGKLTDPEYEIMKTHTRLGAAILAGSDSPMLQMSERVALTHHERWDGSGYPEGIGGEDIPLEGRIVAVADIFDALTSRRIYKPAWPIAVAFDHIAELRGVHLDPELVDAFLSIRKEVGLVAEEFGDAAE
jgi:putative two-component system response regulator